MKKLWLIVFAFLMVYGCSDDNSTDPGTQPANEIWIQGNSFKPASITIAAGTTLTWVNKDGAAHTSTSGSGTPSGVFDSGNLSNGQSFSFTFTTVNSYEYFCKLHPNMRGTVIVQ